MKSLQILHIRRGQLFTHPLAQQNTRQQMGRERDDDNVRLFLINIRGTLWIFSWSSLCPDALQNTTRMQWWSLTQLQYTFLECAWVTRVGLHLWMNIESVSLAGNCTDNMCWEEFFRCEPYFPRRGFCVWIPAGRLSDTCAVRRSHQLCHEPKQNHHGECSTGSTRAFFSSSKSRPSDKNKSDSCK